MREKNKKVLLFISYKDLESSPNILVIRNFNRSLKYR
jgi:hypothetical protein